MTSALRSRSTKGPPSAWRPDWAIGRREPAFVLLHTTAGLGNAVGALATARVNRKSLWSWSANNDVAFEPFLTGRLAGLAGECPVWVDQPAAAR